VPDLPNKHEKSDDDSWGTLSHLAIEPRISESGSMSSSDAIGSAMQAKQDQVYAQIGMAVLRKGLEAKQLQGEAAVELLQAATDMARQIGKGLEFDARA